MSPVTKIILCLLAIVIVIAIMRLLFGPAIVTHPRGADRDAGGGGGDTSISWSSGADHGHHGHHGGFGDGGHGGGDSGGGGGDGGGGGGDGGGGGGDGGH